MINWPFIQLQPFDVDTVDVRLWSTHRIAHHCQYLPLATRCSRLTTFPGHSCIFAATMASATMVVGNVSCDQCRRPPSEVQAYQPDFDTKHYEEGDICAIYESMSLPIYKLLTGEPPQNRSRASIGFKAWTRSKLRISFADSEDVKPPRNPRPCVILERTPITTPSESASPVTLKFICLMATFNDTHELYNLPEVLQHFCIPISPHHLAVPGKPHVHTSPPWLKENTWLIALPFHSSAEIKGRWGIKRDGTRPKGPFGLTPEALDSINKLMESRAISWANLCLANPRLKEQSLKHYKAFCAADNEKRKRQKMRNSEQNMAKEEPTETVNRSEQSAVTRPPVPTQKGGDTKSASLFGGIFKKSDKGGKQVPELFIPEKRSYAQAVTGILSPVTTPQPGSGTQAPPSIASSKSRSTRRSLKDLPLVRKLLKSSKSDIGNA
ncbi:hypothetical protein C8Q79DRAFT_969786 [Trametes meyenii]|nr:hypothetical protein C8Q79DRAFT_969786 [Trametes meyenii]